MYNEKPWLEILNLIKYVLNSCRHKLCSMLSPMNNHNRVCILTIEVRRNFLVLRNPRTAISDLSTRKVSNCVALFSISVALIMQLRNKSWSHFDLIFWFFLIIYNIRDRGKSRLKQDQRRVGSGNWEKYYNSEIRPSFISSHHYDDCWVYSPLLTWFWYEYISPQTRMPAPFWSNYTPGSLTSKKPIPLFSFSCYSRPWKCQEDAKSVSYPAY